MKRRRSVRSLFRFFAIFLSFTMDIKIQADMIFTNVAGHIEVQKGQDLVPVSAQTKMIEPIEVQTFEKAHAKFTVNSVFIGAGETSYILCTEQPECRLFWGVFLVRTPSRDSDWFLLKTPHGDLRTKGGEFLVTVSKAKTAVSVIRGGMEMKDRSSNFSHRLRPGFSLWLGGLTVEGRRARGELQAVTLEQVVYQLKHLGPYTTEELQAKQDELRPLWREAVDTVARETQDQVAGEMLLLNEIRTAQAKRRAKEQTENRYLKKLFRARANGVLDENKVAPSESPRAPSSADLSENADYSDTEE